MSYCPHCGKNIALVGRSHRCYSPLTAQEAPLLTSPPDIIAEKPRKGKSSGAERQAKWREANLEVNRQRARDGMRKKRAKAK